MHPNQLAIKQLLKLKNPDTRFLLEEALYLAVQHGRAGNMMLKPAEQAARKITKHLIRLEGSHVRETKGIDFFETYNERLRYLLLSNETSVIVKELIIKEIGRRVEKGTWY